MINSISNLSVNTVPLTAPSGSSSQVSSTAAGGCHGKDGDRAEISGPGKLFSELKQLAAQDPAKFKQVASDIATKLKAAAGNGNADSTATSTSASSGNSFLNDLAAKFDAAAQSGDASGLQPNGGHAHRHHGPRATEGAGTSGTYNQAGQFSPVSTAAPSEGADLKALFEDITKEVTEALSVKSN